MSVNAISYPLSSPLMPEKQKEGFIRKKEQYAPLAEKGCSSAEGWVLIYGGVAVIHPLNSAK